MTQPELQAALDRDPALKQFADDRAKLLRTLTSGANSNAYKTEAGKAQMQALAASLPPASQALYKEIVAANFDVGSGGRVYEKGMDAVGKWVIGLTLAGMGGIVAAPFIAGAVGGGAAVGGAGAAATLPSTVIGTGFIPAVGGVASGAVPAALAGGAGVAAGAAAATGAGATLPSTTIGTGAIPAVGGVPSGAVPAAMGSTGAMSTIGNIIKRNGSDLLQAGGRSIGAATQAAGQNRQTAASNELASENAWLNLARQEQSERNDARRNLYAAGQLQHMTYSPFDTKPPSVPAETLAGMSALEQQALKRLMQEPQYNTANRPAFVPGTPGAPGMPEDPGIMETIGTYAAPALDAASLIAKYWGK